MKALTQTLFDFTGQTNVYHGKVRDVYSIGEDLLVMIASDRISAFDVILPRGIPYKGQVLNRIAAEMLEQVKDIVPIWVLDVPHPNVTVGKRCEPIRIEMVIRGYLSGHAWRTYRSGERTLCGVTMPEGMKESDRFPEPIITPATKADEGHDEDISKEEIIARGIVAPELYEQMESITRQLFQKGQEIANEHGLILVDTKYEFGLYNGVLTLMDEIHTPDSSRYFYRDGYEERQRSNEPQKQLSKEFVRQWLIEHDFQGLEGQVVPEMSDEFVETVSERYIELFERITGQSFERTSLDQVEDEIRNRVEESLIKLAGTSA